ncbi:hypothetical protein BC835DRAFT_1373741 [Cytidiella melzeri]|nr:hypothetical protein BC835DRAFT_1373741 [Cytidiella melzeri]
MIGRPAGSAVVLSGLTTPLSGSYNISLDNAPPTTFSARSSFNASSPTVLFYTSGLDPSVVHQLKVVNIGASTEDGGSLLLFGTVNVTTTGTQNGGGKKMSSGPTGRTIAAICAVVIVVSIAFVIFLVILLRRRGRVARRKQAFIVNHDVRRERFSFLTRSRLQQDVEKTSPVSNHADESQHESDVLDITAAKHGGDEQDSDDEDNDLQGLHDPQVWHPRHGSQNSDGSYAIDLPELPRPGTGRVRTRSTSESPSPTHRFSDQQARPAKFSLTPSSPTPCSTPRSPKPRGPREMRTVVSTHSKDTSRGILLKEMYSPVADVPVDVRTNDSLLSAGAYLPQPVISPLRVNFEDVLPYEADRRRDAKHRSETSRISLPYSLKQALTGHIRPTYGRDASLANAIGGSPASRFSFLDLNSSNASISSRSNRQSRSASTRSSLKQKGTTPPSNSTPPMPEDPRISLGFSMIMAGGPTASQPSMSPDISLQAVSLSPITIPDHPLPPHIDVPIGVHPTNTSELPSPSDSIPRTLSDIHFRHSTQSCSSPVAESHRTSHRLSVSQRASHHPPLPAASTLQIPQQAEQRPYIVQKILGLPTGSGPSTPYGSPTVSGFASRWSRGRGSASVAGPSSYSRPRTGPPG